jgi:hypothetical protein
MAFAHHLGLGFWRAMADETVAAATTMGFFLQRQDAAITTMLDTATPCNEPLRAPPTYSLGDLVRYALQLGTLGFGGPVALVGFMHRDLVERRQWISEAEYKEGLTLAQIMPGPLAAQLAIYLGYVHYGVLGATMVGIAFVFPSFLMVLALGWAYVAFGGLP